MAIIGFSPGVVIKYVPRYGGNRVSGTPYVVGIKYVPYSKLVKYNKDRSRMAAREKDPAELASVIARVKKKQFFDNVVSVSGVFDGAREITDVAEFYDVAPQALISEIMKAMASTLMLQAGS